MPHSIWIHGEKPAEFIHAELFLHALKKTLPKSRYIITSRHTPTTDWHHSRFPNDVILGAPWNRRKSVERFFDHLSVRLIVLLRSSAGFPSEAYVLAKERGVPIVMVDIPVMSPHDVEHLKDIPIVQFCTRNEEAAAALRQNGVAIERIFNTGYLGLERIVQTPTPDRAYILKELNLDEKALLIGVEGVHLLEEEALLDAVAWLKTRHPLLTLLIRPNTPRQLQRFSLAAEGRGLSVALYSDRNRPRLPDILIIDQRGKVTAPFLDACDAVVAGGTFVWPLGLSGRSIPITAHAKVLAGPYASKDETFAAMPTIPLDQLGTGLDRLLTDDSEAHVSKYRSAILPLAHDSAHRTLEAIRSSIPSPLENIEKTNLWLGATAPAKPKSDPYRISDWKEFRARLEPCRSIFCLANGPSSERPEVLRISHDCLFRANTPWLHRGILDQPQAVFVGAPSTMKEYRDPSAIFVFFTEEWKSSMSAFGGEEDSHPFNYFILDFFSSLNALEIWPTNGAVMIAAAVTLQPDQITLAGYDLFSHPNGRYPGDLTAVNEYALAHDRNHEIDFIKPYLEKYQGNLVILSPILAKALRAAGFHAFKEE